MGITWQIPRSHPHVAGQYQSNEHGRNGPKFCYQNTSYSRPSSLNDEIEIYVNFYQRLVSGGKISHVILFKKPFLFKLKYNPFDSKEEKLLFNTFSQNYFTEQAGYYIGIGVLSQLLKDVQFWEDPKVKKKGLNFKNYQVINYNSKKKSADFATLPSTAEHYNELIVECKSHLPSLDSYNKIKAKDSVLIKETYIKSDFTEAWSQIKASLDEKVYYQGIITDLYGIMDKEKPNIQLNIEIYSTKRKIK